MKTKFAKRSVSEYQQSLSSHSSCHDNVITRIQFSSLKGYSSSNRQNIMMINNCSIEKTPKKNTTQINKTQSMEKIDLCCKNSFKEENQEDQRQNKYWQFQSQDSKLRKKNNYYSQLQKINYKQHAKVLTFQDEKFDNTDKQNQPLRINLQDSSSDNQNQILQRARKLQKRKFGRTLFLQDERRDKEKAINFLLPNIQEQQNSLFF